MMTKSLRVKICSAAVLSLFLAGCATTPPNDAITPLTDAQLSQLQKTSRAPEVFGLTAYRSDSGPIFAGGQRVHQGDRATLTFASEPNSTAPLVLMQPGGEGEVRALVDTTSRDNWLTLPAAALFHVTPLGTPPFARKAEHVYDDIGGYVSVAQKIRLDKMHVENALFFVHAANGPIGPVGRWENKPRLDAVLGSAMLRACQHVQFDFVHRSVIFSATSSYQPNSEKLIASLPMKDAQGAIACEGLVDGKRATILIDTGGDFEFAMTDPPDSSIRQLSAGDLVFRNVSVENCFELGLGLPDHPRIGRRLLAKFKVTFDFRKKLIHFEKPDA